LGLKRSPVKRITWRPCWRIIPSRHPTIDLFERVADPKDWDALNELEGKTNERLRDEIGEIQLVPPEDRVSGPGATYIMASFTHRNLEGSRFSDGSYGVFYAAQEFETSVAETVYHRERFMRHTDQSPMKLEMRVLNVDLNGRLHDIRKKRRSRTGIYDPDSYAASQALALPLRQSGSWGIVYDSVRYQGGRCAAVFRPPVLSNCRQEGHLCYVWDGQRITDYYKMGSMQPV
jgi:hypothetical protein